ncbi:DoxX family protein [Chitinophaga vietnamensis]|uniref:DoxX family protein n=1 Tax=Chitinophaga vietnamensis TaxID=2593957 RepID=UPI001177C45A|nr:hypothetical protein [Chitinophaga vietnamensis]
MKPLFVLIITALLSAGISKLFTGSWHWLLAGNLAMCLMLCFTALGHFLFTKGMTMMLPPFVPFKKEMVYLTGVIEPCFGIALLFPAVRHIAGMALIFFFVIILPANIYAAIKRVNYEQASFDGPGAAYLYKRVPMQLLFIGWVYYFSIWLK